MTNQKFFRRAYFLDAADRAICARASMFNAGLGWSAFHGAIAQAIAACAEGDFVPAPGPELGWWQEALLLPL